MRTILLGLTATALALALTACTVEGTYSSDGLTTSAQPCKVAVTGLQMVAELKLTCVGGEAKPVVQLPADR